MPSRLQLESPDPSLSEGVQSKASNVLSRRDRRKCLAEALFDKSEDAVHNVVPQGLPMKWFGPLSKSPRDLSPKQYI